MYLQSVSCREYLITFSTIIRSCPVHYKIQTNAYLKVNSSNGVTIICVRSVGRSVDSLVPLWTNDHCWETLDKIYKLNGIEWLNLLLLGVGHFQHHRPLLGVTGQRVSIHSPDPASSSLLSISSSLAGLHSSCPFFIIGEAGCAPRPIAGSDLSLADI